MHASYGDWRQPHTRNRGECIPSGLRRRLLLLAEKWVRDDRPRPSARPLRGLAYSPRRLCFRRRRGLSQSRCRSRAAAGCGRHALAASRSELGASLIAKLLAVGGYGRFETTGRMGDHARRCDLRRRFCRRAARDQDEHGAARQTKAVRADGLAFDSLRTAAHDARDRPHRRPEDRLMSTESGTATRFVRPNVFVPSSCSFRLLARASSRPTPTTTSAES